MTQNDLVAQETLARKVMSGSSFVHVTAPAAGSLDSHGPPLLPLSPTQSDSATHEMAWPSSAGPVPTGEELAVHAAAPPLGFVEVKTMLGEWDSAIAPPATHRGADVHETPRIGPVPFTSAAVQAPEPSLGLELSTLPALSTATHSDDEAHETPLMELVPSILMLLQAPEPPVGLVDVVILPMLSLTTHSGPRTHETPVTAFEPVLVSTGTSDQAPAPPAGLVDTNASPFSSTATQSEAEAQDTPLSGRVVL
jgi:hypothetical protein